MLTAALLMTPSYSEGHKWTRDIALIYYLAKDWKESMGGNLRDLTGDQTFTPEFNSLVAFRVPRMHEVTACTHPARNRFSIFGWFLSPDEYPNVLRKQKAQSERESKIASANSALGLSGEHDEGDEGEDGAEGKGDGEDDDVEPGGVGGGGGGVGVGVGDGVDVGVNSGTAKIHKKKEKKKQLLKLKMMKEKKNKKKKK